MTRARRLVALEARLACRPPPLSDGWSWLHWLTNAELDELSQAACAAELARRCRAPSAAERLRICARTLIECEAAATRRELTGWPAWHADPERYR